MKRPANKKRSVIVGRKPYLAISLMEELERAFESKTGIEAKSPMMYEDSEAGQHDYTVDPRTDIRTDKFDRMIDYSIKAEKAIEEGLSKMAKDYNEKRQKAAAEGETQPSEN